MIGTTIAKAASQVARSVKRRFPELHRKLMRSDVVRSAYSRVVSPLAPARDVSQMLHELRSAHLSKMPKVTGTMLSAGCAGTWYFNWIRDQAGHLGHHIGIEFYTPKPADLPDNVEWIANTVGDMDAVADGSCELVFSGQNLEHLWPEEVIGFFNESNRVLVDGGWLVVDSPNRLMTAPLNWSHPEHTVEVTPAEARKLAELAGFEVISVAGLWLCRDPATGEVLPFIPNDGDAAWPTLGRIIAAEDDPDNSFIWWLTARKRGPSDHQAVATEMNRIFQEAWPERTHRFVVGIGRRIAEGGRNLVTSRAEQTGPLIYGPYLPVKAGSYQAKFKVEVRSVSDPNRQVVMCDVLGIGGRELASRKLTAAEIEAANGEIILGFSLAELEFGVQMRCISLGAGAVTCEIPVSLIDQG